MPRIISLTTIIPEMLENSENYGCTVDDIPIIVGGRFIDELIQKYGTFSFLRMYEDENVTDYKYFENMYKVFRNSSQEQWFRYYKAILEIYDPSLDFERYETTAYKNTHDIKYNSTFTTTPNTTQEIEHGKYTTDSVTTFESDTLYVHDKDSNGGTDTITNSGSNTTEHTGTDTVTDTRLEDDNYTSVSGRNSGSAKLISDELDLRARDDTETFVLKQFATQYLFLEV